MSELINFLHIDILSVVETAGYFGLIGIIFAESGLFFGFFFPGDSLLFSAGLLASQGYLNIWILTPLLGLAAILGDSVGYWFGAKVGPRIFYRDDSFFFHKDHIERTRAFYAKHGPKAIILARFIPVVRTFTPILAGVGKMEYGIFLRYNIIGALLWAVGITLLGYFLGAAVPGIDKYLIPIVLLIILTSFIPVFSEFYKSWKTGGKL